MSRSLPPKPNLDHLRKEAKAILKAHKAGDRSICVILRHLGKFRSRADEEILSANVALREIQQALAVEYGFKDWKALRSRVESTAIPTAEDAGPVLEGPPVQAKLFGSREDGVDTKADTEDRHCSFCGKSQTQTWKLIAGPHAYICDACVFTCCDLLSKQEDGKSTGQGKEWAARTEGIEKRVERMRTDVNRAIDHVLHAIKA